MSKHKTYNKVFSIYGSGKVFKYSLERSSVDHATIIFNAYRARVEADGGVVEAFSCTIAALRLPAVNVGQYLFDNYAIRVLADGGVVEAEQCTVNALNNIQKWELY